jgi:replication initiation and membrane attachment protein DnaB
MKALLTSGKSGNLLRLFVSSQNLVVRQAKKTIPDQQFPFWQNITTVFPKWELLQIEQSGASQTPDKVFLRLAPDWEQLACIAKITNVIIMHTFVKRNRAIDGFYNIQQSDFLRRFCQRNVATLAARSLQQTGNREL